MDRLIGIIYPYEQETLLETQLSLRVQVEIMVNPSTVETYRYDRILIVGKESYFPKVTLDKLAVLASRHEGLFEWVSDDIGKAAEIINNLPKRSELGAFQTTGSSEIKIYAGQKLSLLFDNKNPTLSEWRMKVQKGGSGVASLTFFEADSGKLLRSYDIYISEFTRGWFNFRLPNPIFKAQRKLVALFHMRTLEGPPPVWVSQQGWSDHAMLVDGKKSDFVACFETL